MDGPNYTKYIEYYDQKEIDDLDMNIWKESFMETNPDGVTGRHLYVAEPRHESEHIFQGGRDKQIHYLYNIERDKHPNHSSRFGYAYGPYGYLSGPFPGKYQEPMKCTEYDPQPPDMAPKRFYAYPFQSNYYRPNLSQGILDYYGEKDLGMRYPTKQCYPANKN